MRKLAYILSFVMLPLAAMAGDIKYTRPVLTLKNDTLTVEFSMSVEEVRVIVSRHMPLLLYCVKVKTIMPCLR